MAIHFLTTRYLDEGEPELCLGLVSTPYTTSITYTANGLEIFEGVLSSKYNSLNKAALITG